MTGYRCVQPVPLHVGLINLHIVCLIKPRVPNLANSFLRAVFTNQGVYILPKVVISNMADFGNVTIIHLWKFCMAAKMYQSITQLRGMSDYL